MYFYISLTFWFIIDILSKYIASNYLKDEIYVIWNYFSLKLIYNNGIAFSLPIRWIILKALTIAILVGIIYYYFKHEKAKKSRIIDVAFWLMLGWAFWNAVERILLGEVTDFLRIKYFAIFNFGDIFINIWVLLLLYLYLCKTWTNKM